MSKQHNVGLPPEQALEMLDKVSPTFCLAKWLQVTLNLHTGTNASCCLTPPTNVPLDRLEDNLHEFHNTKINKRDRAQLLNGVKAKSCQFCWGQEEKGERLRSERIYKSASPWANEYLDEVLQAGADKDIAPTYLEVSFSSKCNLKCIYCSPQTSSSIYHEIKKFGPYTDSSSLNDLREVQKNFEFSEFEEKNPYVPYFYKWFEKISTNLAVLRFTGGEPLLSENVFFILELMQKKPHPGLTIEINSNLSLPEATIQRLINKLQQIPKENYKGIKIISSIDTGFEESAYIRNGLNPTHFKRNVALLLESMPEIEFRFTVTFSLFSLFNFNELIDYTLKLKREYKTYDKILLSIYPLISPYHLSTKILPVDYDDYFKSIKKKLEEHRISDDEPYGFNAYEIDSFDKVYEFYKDRYPKSVIEKLQKDFYYFIRDFDFRKKTSLLKTFPELKSFLEYCLHHVENDLRRQLVSSPSTIEDFKELVMFYQREHSVNEKKRGKVLDKIGECVTRLTVSESLESVAVCKNVLNESHQNDLLEIVLIKVVDNHYRSYENIEFFWVIHDILKNMPKHSLEPIRSAWKKIPKDRFFEMIKKNLDILWSWLEIIDMLEFSEEEICFFLISSSKYVDDLYENEHFFWAMNKILGQLQPASLTLIRDAWKEIPFKHFFKSIEGNLDLQWAWVDIINKLEYQEEQVWSFIENSWGKVPSVEALLKIYRWNDFELWKRRYNGKEVKGWLNEILLRNDIYLVEEFLKLISMNRRIYGLILWFCLTSPKIDRDLIKVLKKYTTEEMERVSKVFLSDWLRSHPTSKKRVFILRGLLFSDDESDIS